MTKNPFINALGAVAYIVLVASTMFYVSNHAQHNVSIMVPIMVLSLFTLSAAVMGYIFLAQPVQLYLGGKKKQAINLFLKTVGIFAGITVLVLILLLNSVI